MWIREGIPEEVTFALRCVSLSEERYFSESICQGPEAERPSMFEGR